MLWNISTVLLVFTLAFVNSETTTPTPEVTGASPVYNRKEPPPFGPHANYPFAQMSQMYPMAYANEESYLYPKQPVPVQSLQEHPGYMSSMIPAAQAALQVALRLFAKAGLFLVGGAALLVVGGIFVTAICSITPICTLTFHGLGIRGIDKESMRAMMTPDKISAAAALVQDAIGRYQRLQRAVGN